jgi:prepilin-type processing-associated H-X9-DG protein
MRRAARGGFSWLLVFVGVVGLGFGLAAPSHAQPNSPARFVPRKNLIAYFEIDGLDAHAAAWKKTAAYRLLNETTLGALVEDLATQAADALLERALKVEKPEGAKVVKAVEALFQRGMAVGVVDTDGPGPGLLVAVVRDGAKPELLDGFLTLERIPGMPASKTRERRGRTVHEVGTGSWWLEKGDLVLTSVAPDALDGLLDVLDGKAPNALDHPIRVELTRSTPELEPVAYAFFDMSLVKIPEKDAKESGLEGLKRVDYRAGFQGEAIASEFRLLAPKPRKGLLHLFDQPAFTTSALPPIPADQVSFQIFSINIPQTYELIRSMQEPAPAADQETDTERAFREATGISLRKDVLARLGPKVIFFERPPVAEAPPGAFVGTLPEYNLMLQVDDPAAAGKVLDTLVVAINKALKKDAANNDPAPQFVKREGDRPGYRLDLPQGAMPFGGLEPTVLISDRYLLASTTPGGAERCERATRGVERWSPTGPFQTALDRMPKSVIILSVDDPRGSLASVVTNLPTTLQMLQGFLAQAGGGGAGIQIDPKKIPEADELNKRLFPNASAWAVDDQGVRRLGRASGPAMRASGATTIGVTIALLLPAVQAAREAARRAQCTNNCKQIGLAIANYENLKGTYPPAAIAGEDGKPLLSWRVAILPFLEQNELYKQFHLDEPWDSPHNKALVEKMPKSYACPSDPTGNAKKGMTTYRVFLGPKAAFEGSAGQKLNTFTDGTSNTILMVESKDAVPWTKPDELPFDPEADQPPAGPGSHHPGGYQALFADGSVKFLKTTLDTKTLRALITRNGGEVIKADAR